jgi:hypothetical protein
MGKLHDREQQATTDPRLLAWFAPAEASGYHQVDDQEHRIGELEHDALADAADTSCRLSANDLERRIDRPQDERTLELNAFDWAVHDPHAQRLEIRNHVRQLRHAAIVCVK